MENSSILKKDSKYYETSKIILINTQNKIYYDITAYKRIV